MPELENDDTGYVLQLVYDCQPNAGSDPGIGWQAVVHAAGNHRVLALTKASNRASIESAPSIANVTWHFVDVPEKLGPLSTGRSLGDAVHNVFWLRKARKLTVRLMKTHKIRLTHYVTFSAYWMPVPFADLGVPHVFGPVSGGESEPASLRAGQSMSARVKERIRTSLQTAGTRTPSWQRMAKSPSTLMIAATEATSDRMKKAGATNVEVWRTGFSLTDSLIEELSAIERTTHPADAPVIVTSGRQLHWKGHDIAVDAFATISASVPEARLIVIGNGPEHEALIDQAKQRGLSGKIDFLPNASRGTERALIANADLFLFPSRRDSGSTLLPLVQVLRVPIVAFDTGAVMRTTGGHAQLADLSGSHTPAKALAQAALYILLNPSDAVDMVRQGHDHARAFFGESAAKEAIDTWYEQVA
jgi:glycosyltransferase involved in cell wall biosynthesis